MRKIILVLLIFSPIAGCRAQNHIEAPPGTKPLPSRATALAPSGPEAEARLLAEHADLGIRAGPTLIIRYAGEDPVTLVDDPKGCNPHSVANVIMVKAGPGPRLSPIAEIRCHFGSLDNLYLLLPDGDKFPIVDEVSASPDGQTLAMADNSMGPGPNRGRFTLINWPTLNKAASFPAGCHVVAWQSSDSLTAHCWHNDGSEPTDADDSRSVYFAARIFRVSKGPWQLKGTAWLGSDFSSLKDAKGALPSFSGLSFDDGSMDQPQN